MTDKEGETRVTVRVDADTVEHLDELIMRAKIEGVLDKGVTRSDLIRNEIVGIVEELEGKSSPMQQAAD